MATHRDLIILLLIFLLHIQRHLNSLFYPIPMSDADAALKRSAKDVEREAEVSDISSEKRRHNLHPPPLPSPPNGT